MAVPYIDYFYILGGVIYVRQSILNVQVACDGILLSGKDDLWRSTIGYVHYFSTL